MTREDDIPTVIKHYSIDEVWRRKPAFFWKLLTLLGIAALILALPFVLVLLPLLSLWDRLRGYDGGWTLDEVERYLRSIVNTEDDQQLSSLMDDLDCVFLYKHLDDPFLESIRLRCQENIDRSGWGGPGGFVDRDGLRLILEDVQVYQRKQQTS